MEKKFSREIIKHKEDSTAGDDVWENVTENVFHAKVQYDYLTKIIFPKLGVNLTRDTKILELGSGNAILLDYMKKQGLNTIGVDIKPRGKNNSSQVIVRIEQLPFPDASFDIAYSSNLFDKNLYNQNENLMVREIARILKPGGVYVLRNVAGLEGLPSIPHDLLIPVRGEAGDIEAYKKI